MLELSLSKKQLMVNAKPRLALTSKLSCLFGGLVLLYIYIYIYLLQKIQHIKKSRQMAKLGHNLSTMSTSNILSWVWDPRYNLKILNTYNKNFKVELSPLTVALFVTVIKAEDPGEGLNIPQDVYIMEIYTTIRTEWNLFLYSIDMKRSPSYFIKWKSKVLNSIRSTFCVKRRELRILTHICL